MHYNTNDVVSGVDGYFGRFPVSEQPEELFHSLMVYALVTPDRSGTGDRQIPWTGSPVGGVYAEVDKAAFVNYGPAQFVAADIMLGWYDGAGKVYVMDVAAPENLNGVPPIDPPREARPGIKPFIVRDDPPAPGANITLLVDPSRRKQPLNGTIIRGSGLGVNAVRNDHFFLPNGDHAHVSQHRGPDMPTKSTRIHDINAEGEPDPDVWAGLDKLTVVMPQAGGCAGGIEGEYTLALNYAAKTGPGYGLAVFEETGGYAPGKTVVKPELKTVMGYLAYGKKGPATAGHPTADKHKCGETPEGAVNSAHDHGERFVYKNIEMDGPELFEEVYEVGVGEGVIKVRVHKQWKADDVHEGPCGPVAGRWREHAKVMSAPIWDEPGAKDDPAAKEESAAKEEPGAKEQPPGTPIRPPESPITGPGGGDGTGTILPGQGPEFGDGFGRPVDGRVFRVFYDPAWDEGLPEIKFPTFGQAGRPDSEKPVRGTVEAAMQSVSGEWQGLPEIQPGNANTPSSLPPADFGPLELRRHSIEYAARPNLFTKPKLRVPSTPPAPPETLHAMPPGDPQREAYMEDLSAWYHENMLAGITGETWDAHAKAPVALHATAFAKTKPNGFSYNVSAKYARSRDLSRPRQFVTGTADGGVVYHPHEVEHWMLKYGYAEDDLPANPSQPEVMFRKGVRLTFAEGLKASDSSRGVEGAYFEQTAADILSVIGIDTAGASIKTKHLRLADLVLELGQYSDAERGVVVSPRAGAVIWNTDDEVVQYYDGSAWVDVGNVIAGSNLTDDALTRGDGGAKGIQTSEITVSDLAASAVTISTVTAATAITLQAKNATGNNNGGNLTIRAGNAETALGTGNGGALTLDGGSEGGAGGTEGTISIGTTYAASVAIAKTGVTTTVNGPALGKNSIKSDHATAGIGYATGAGGTVTQTTSKSTGVTLNTVCGQITTHSESLGDYSSTAFTVTNSAIAVGDTVVLSLAETGVEETGFSARSYVLSVENVVAGAFDIVIWNFSGGALAEALVIDFAVVKAVNS